MKQMRKKLLLVGILAVTLSTISATQYVRADLGFSYEIVHPSDADIRYIGSDNAPDGLRVIRGNNAGNDPDPLTSSSVSLEFGRWAIGQTKVYTAAFGIVNEESFDVDINGINAVFDGDAEIQIWLHGDEDVEATTSTVDAVLMYDSEDGGAQVGSWTLAAGDQDPDTANDGTDDVDTEWCPNQSHVRFAEGSPLAESETADYVWVQVVLTVPAGADLNTFGGTISFNFESTTEI
jgi:hypothetical protein